MRVKVGSDHVTVHELLARVEADDAWTKVVIPGDRAGTMDDGFERANWAQEMVGRCALPAAPPGEIQVFHPNRDWLAFRAADGKTQIFFFKDPDYAAAFRLARG